MFFLRAVQPLPLATFIVPNQFPHPELNLTELVLLAQVLLLDAAGNSMSIHVNKEYGGIIFKAEDGTYGYARGMLGKSRTVPTYKESSKYLPDGAKPAGQYHTHGDYGSSDLRTGYHPFNYAARSYHHLALQ
ncbi:DUF4329 domain-containing protein [Xenorhabdus bovienii]|uniref:DUF4329 domain-containing protein n=1 Tax=Xenorhabdus bovienii TaxID=40576 RepID=UPI003DA244AA